jgi:3-deoxy-D-manno-octulosonate 8-phosphate phosphatase (KDO 8-P phosphatase)
VAVADASLETREHAHYVTQRAGGNGAVREVIELVLKAQNRWTDLIRVYLRESAANI